MTKVFIAGSRRLSRLGRNVKDRLDNIVTNGLTVLIGDANGADKAVQQYLASKSYDNVVVFCVGRHCRNNLRGWLTRQLPSSGEGRRDFAFYAKKDRLMAGEADYGLMLWDGDSRGTLTSAVDLIRRGKPVVVYFAPSKSFETFKGPGDLAILARRASPEVLRRIERDLDDCGSPQVAAARQPLSDLLLFQDATASIGLPRRRRT